MKPSDIRIVAKTVLRLVRTSDTEEIDVEKIIYHKKYSIATLFNDIALLILVKDIKLKPNMADVIALPKQNIQPDKLCTVIGWGMLYMVVSC